MMKISSLKDLMPEVKVGESIDTNREVNEKRVAELAEYYVRAGDRVVIPPILADTHLDFEFKKEGEIEVGVGNAANKIAVGILQVPLAIDDAMIILDGQHRVAGLVKAYRETMSKLKNLRDEKGRLEDQESDPLQRERLRSVNTEIATNEALEARFNRDTVTVEIRTNTPRDLHKEWFVTIADNAKGINKSERARLDTINMSSLVAKKVCDKHILLSGNIGDSGQPRVDFRNNMAKRSSDTIYSLDNVRNVVRTIPGIRLRELLDKYFPEKGPDFLNVDIEGADLEALKSGEFESLPIERRPLWILVESNAPLAAALKTDTVQLLMSYGYELWLVLPFASLLRVAKI
jgi:hypothetical protein